MLPQWLQEWDAEPAGLQPKICAEFLQYNPPRPTDDPQVQALAELRDQQHSALAGIFHTLHWRWSHCYTSSSLDPNYLAHLKGALRAFLAGDYACPLIHLFIGPREIHEAQRV